MIKIYNMDCLKGLYCLPTQSIDLVVTSPPYNQNLSTQAGDRLLYEDNLSNEEYVEFIEKIFKQIYRILKDNGSFFYNYKSDTKNNQVNSAFFHLVKVIGKFNIAGEIIWKYAGNFDSNRTRFPIDYEIIFHLVKRAEFKFSDCGEKLSSIWRINHVMAGTQERRACEIHPCPYPIKLIKKIIRHTTDEKDIVCDPFLGSGTTAVACKQLNRNFIGFEISKEYCEIAKRRLEQETLFPYQEQQKLEVTV